VLMTLTCNNWQVQPNTVTTNSIGPQQFICYNRERLCGKATTCDKK
jgi:hypothetical protein